MEEGRGRSNSTLIIASLITAVAGIATAALSNWDKLTGSTTAAPTPQPQPQPVQPTQQEASEPAAAPARQPAEDSPPPVVSSAIPAIAGQWGTPNGAMVMAQNGVGFSFEEFLPDGRQISRGAGHFEGSRMIYVIDRLDLETGLVARIPCFADVAPGGRFMRGACRVAGQDVPAWASR